MMLRFLERISSQRAGFPPFSYFGVVPKRAAGFSIIEITIGIALIAIVSSLIVTTYIESNRTQSLEKDAAIVAAAFERARSLTLSSAGDQRYGVHVEASKVVIYSGDTYIAGSVSNRTETLNPLVTISGYSFTGGGSDVLFKRLTGETDQAGTLTISLVSDPSRSITLSILGTGVIDLE